MIYVICILDSQFLILLKGKSSGRPTVKNTVDVLSVKEKECKKKKIKLKIDSLLQSTVSIY